MLLAAFSSNSCRAFLLSQSGKGFSYSISNTQAPGWTPVTDYKKCTYYFFPGNSSDLLNGQCLSPHQWRQTLMLWFVPDKWWGSEIKSPIPKMHPPFCTHPSKRELSFTIFTTRNKPQDYPWFVLEAFSIFQFQHPNLRKIVQELYSCIWPLVFTHAEQATCPDCQKQTTQMNISTAQADTMRQMTLKKPSCP